MHLAHEIPAPFSSSLMSSSLSHLLLKNPDYVSLWQRLFLPTNFTIQLIFVLFMGLTVLFVTIYGSHCAISVNFYLRYFQQKVFSFCKISESQTNLYTSSQMSSLYLPI